ncbi:MAG: outer membrane protein assembly factor BamA [Candidatus Acidiferrales bacterium]
MTRAMAAGGSIFLRAFESLAFVFLLILAGGQSLCAQQTGEPGASPYVIERIEFIGNHRVQRDTLLARIFSRPGDPYSVDAVRRDFQALWNTHFFEDIRLEVEDSTDQPNGKILLFFVTERPIIRRIEYRGNKSISESDILDAYKDKKVGLVVESQFDPTVIMRAEVVIKGLLAEHGHQFATVKPTYERIAATNAVKLVFNIDEGPKVRVGTITIEGNKAFSSRKIIRTMRHDRPYVIPLYFANIPISHKTFDRPMLDEDMEVGIRGLYQDHGYFKVDVNVASLKTVEVNRKGIPGPFPGVGRKRGKATNIVIKIDEGEQYRMGKLTFRSADPDQGLVFRNDILRSPGLFPLKEGDIFSAAKVRKSLDNYKKLYGEYGYIDFVATPLTDPDDTKKIVNMTMEFDQQKQYFVRRIEFSGNTTTRDKVIRRELLLDEGQMFNNRLWELSILRLNQLGYFNDIKPEDAELKRNVKAGTVDITLKVKEKAKQSISFSGGVSGLEGTFIGASYQTNNFLGLGETLTISAQIGNIQQNITFGFTEPYLFDRPISTGFTVFTSRFSYNTARQYGLLYGGSGSAINPALQENYNNDSKGFTVFASYPWRKLSKTGFTRIGLNYGWSTTNIKTFSQSAALLFEEIQFTSIAGPSALNGIIESKITPTITYDSTNSQTYPTQGKRISLGISFEGGPIQGNVNSVGSTFSMSYFRPMYHKRNVLAFHVQTTSITGYGGKNVPPYDRFYLGGENDVRGYDFYTISPFVALPQLTTVSVPYLNPTILNNGNPTQETANVPILEYVPTRPGGDLDAVGNVEYRIPIAGPVTVSFFNDLGVNGNIRASDLKPPAALVQSLQQQYPNPDFRGMTMPGTLPVLPGTNFRPHTSAGIEFDLVLPVVQAPLRFYIAYNYLRLNRTIIPPLATADPAVCGDSAVHQPPGAAFSFNTNPQLRQSLIGLGVYCTQVVPYLENQVLAPFESTEHIPPSLLEPKLTFRFTVGRSF